MCLRQLIYNEKHPAAFICYKHVDDDNLPNLIREHLKNKGFFAFLNHQDIRLGEDYDDYLARSIINADNFILVVSESTFLKIAEPDDYVCKEIRIALKNNIKIIPVINLDKSGSFPDETDLPSDIQKLVKKQFIEYRRKNPDDTLKKIRKALKKPWLIFSRIVLILLLLSLTLFLLFKAVPNLSLKDLETKINGKDSADVRITNSDSILSQRKTANTRKSDSIKKAVMKIPSNHKITINEYLKKNSMETLLRESLDYRNTYLSSRKTDETFDTALSGLKKVCDSLNAGKYLSDSAIIYYVKASSQYNNQPEHALDNYYKTIKSVIPDTAWPND
jgi:hypothetical protein